MAGACGEMGDREMATRKSGQNTDDPDVITIERSGEHFRLLYDVKGRFTVHRISPEEATFKLCKVKKHQLGAKGVPYVVTHDGRTIRYPDPAIKANDTIKFDFVQNKIVDVLKFEAGNVVMVTGGRNMGRSGVITHRERHLGGFDIVHVKDVLDRSFATRYVVTFRTFGCDFWRRGK
jgi:small subunit ribosomal protein S4e